MQKKGRCVSNVVSAELQRQPISAVTLENSIISEIRIESEIELVLWIAIDDQSL